VAHAHDAGDGCHRQAVGVGNADSFVPLLAEGLAGLVERGFALGVVLGEGRELGASVGCFAFWTGDSWIV
jgi:hypothetical protein